MASSMKGDWLAIDLTLTPSGRTTRGQNDNMSWNPSRSFCAEFRLNWGFIPNVVKDIELGIATDEPGEDMLEKVAPPLDEDAEIMVESLSNPSSALEGTRSSTNWSCFSKRSSKPDPISASTGRLKSMLKV
ncbi:hypothetical protein PG993_012185 [Apiospora rasikravindrae]|uniref:Uncharacterized protein n=1 Tax=Apiospora rasikravindrae TaxID=990691 RepID=A0ABR1S1S7_9PEZI